MPGWRGRTVLVVSPTPTAPMDFGNRRYIQNGVRLLRDQGARIIFVYYPAEQDWRASVPVAQLHEMQAQWDEFYIVPVTRPLHPDPVGAHHAVDEWWDEALGAMISWIFATHRIDLCLVHYTWLSRALTLCPAGVLRVLVTHDRFAGRKEMLQAHGIRPEFFYLTEDSERSALLRADIVWAIKDDEAQYFRGLSGRPTLVFPHFEAPDLAYRCRVPRHGLLRFGFFAAKNQINRVNYRRFFEMLRLMVQHWLLPARFVLAGSLCELFEPGEFPFIERLGRVETVEAFYRAVDVVVVPMAFSTGLKIKVGEALGYGKALIAHAHAFEGYNPTHRFHALPSFEAMGRAIVELVDAPALIDEMEPAAVRSARDCEQRAIACASATLTGTERRRRFVLLAPADLLALPQVADHVSETCHYLGYIARPEVYVTGDARRVPGAVWRQLSGCANLTAAPLDDMAAQDAAPFADVTFLDMTTFRAPGCGVLYALRCDDSFAAWHRHAEDRLLRMEQWRGAENTIESSCAAVAALLERDREPVTLIGTEPAEACVRRQGLAARLVRIPLLHSGTHSRLLRRLREQRRNGICLLAEADGTVLRRLVTLPAFRARWAGQPCRIMAQPALLTALQTDPAFAGFSFEPLDDLPALLSRGPSVPELIVQLDPAPGAQGWLREFCIWAVLPYVSLADTQGADGAAAQVALALTPQPASRRVRQVQQVLHAVLSPPFIETEKDALLHSWPFVRDSGWAWLWRLVKDRIDPG